MYVAMLSCIYVWGVAIKRLEVQGLASSALCGTGVETLCTRPVRLHSGSCPKKLNTERHKSVCACVDVDKETRMASAQENERHGARPWMDRDGPRSQACCSAHLHKRAPDDRLRVALRCTAVKWEARQQVQQSAGYSDMP